MVCDKTETKATDHLGLWLSFVVADWLREHGNDYSKLRTDTLSHALAHARYFLRVAIMLRALSLSEADGLMLINDACCEPTAAIKTRVLHWTHQKSVTVKAKTPKVDSTVEFRPIELPGQSVRWEWKDITVGPAAIKLGLATLLKDIE